MIRTPFYIGKLSLKNNIVYSPLAGCSDYPFRKIAKKYGAGLMFCEMVKIDALVRYDVGTLHLLDYDKDMHPIGAQLCGSKVSLARQAAKIIEDLGFDIIDLNCGCPVDKVTKDGSGSALLKETSKIAELLHEIVQAVSIPVTLKIRSGWDHEHIVAGLVTELAEKAGASAIFVHGRTRSQGYEGFASLDYIQQAKKAAKNILVFGNGDLFSPEAAYNMLQYTHCDGVLISRGTLGNPWLGQDIEDFLKTGSYVKKEPQNYLEGFITHLGYIAEYSNPQKMIIDTRRVGCWYSKFFKNISKEFRSKIAHVKTKEDIYLLIEELQHEFLIT